MNEDFNNEGEQNNSTSKTSSIFKGKSISKGLSKIFKRLQINNNGK